VNNFPDNGKQDPSSTNARDDYNNEHDETEDGSEE
jgi:hypothetical protein